MRYRVFPLQAHHADERSVRLLGLKASRRRGPVSYDDPGAEPVRIDRRAAMKAALAGAAAAAVWQAPRIEGLSVAPDVAQAATGTCVGGTTQFVKNSNGALLGRCWGNTELVGAACGVATVNTALPAPWSFDAVLTFGGEWTTLGSSNGFVTIDVNGIDPPFERCTANITGACSGNTFSAVPSTLNFNSDVTAVDTAQLECSGSAPVVGQSASATITIACTCAPT
jgi:hypothetical protein